ncbi:hypothetical protein UYSO10_0299 [Kosakonia radicincitans]|uniref:hypothetical protein n=1 Tax=Kosakonia radicincitans TaxID=283686 RepID=UPI00125265F2|nr:hypothetical protein [Kosakonia radicincitans]VVT45007.1 hypothetical protein UYSO10_0299 [Kosakonia radicincitans]
MNASKNPSEKVMSELELSWLDASEDTAARLFIWRVPANGESLLDAFFALQQHPQGRSLPDLFLSFNTPFETGYSYSEALGREFVEQYEATPDAAFWDAEPWLPCYSAGQLRSLLQNFAEQFTDDLRYLVLVLKPSAVSDESAMLRWLHLWLEQGADAPRLLLIDTVEQPIWQSLYTANPRHVRLIEDRIDGMKVMHQTAQQQTDADADRLLFRRYLADAMLLLEKGSAAQVAARGSLALAIAQCRGWADQQAMMHNLIAGGWLKGRDHAQAVEHYRQAQSISGEVPDQAVKGQLRTQSTFGEAGAGSPVKTIFRRRKSIVRQRLRRRPSRIRSLRWRAGGCAVFASGCSGIARRQWKSTPAPSRRRSLSRSRNAGRPPCRWCSRICCVCMTSGEPKPWKPAPRVGRRKNRNLLRRWKRNCRPRQQWNRFGRPTAVCNYNLKRPLR